MMPLGLDDGFEERTAYPGLGAGISEISRTTRGRMNPGNISDGRGNRA